MCGSSEVIAIGDAFSVTVGSGTNAEAAVSTVEPRVSAQWTQSTSPLTPHAQSRNLQVLVRQYSVRRRWGQPPRNVNSKESFLSKGSDLFERYRSMSCYTRDPISC